MLVDGIHVSIEIMMICLFEKLISFHRVKPCTWIYESDTRNKLSRALKEINHELNLSVI